MLIDSHCHLTFPELAHQVDEVLRRAAEAGVTHAITIGTDLDDASRAVALAQRRAEAFAVVGVHPHEAGRVPGDFVERLRELACEPRVVGLGETGLDYHYDHSDRSSQRAVFEAQLSLAQELSLPVVIHCREAYDDALAVLAGFSRLPRVVFHCFTGDAAEARRILDAGYWISLTGVVTFRKSDALREIARFVPDDRMMVETDAPYLSPEPVRHRRPNEPAFLVHTARHIAESRGRAFDDFVSQMRRNTICFFGLPLD
jgi:TatD DNase family protein